MVEVDQLVQWMSMVENGRQKWEDVERLDLLMKEEERDGKSVGRSITAPEDWRSRHRGEPWTLHYFPLLYDLLFFSRDYTYSQLFHLLMGLRPQFETFYTSLSALRGMRGRFIPQALLITNVERRVFMP